MRREGSTLEGQEFLRKNICTENLQNARILHENCSKDIFPVIFFLGGAPATQLQRLWKGGDKSPAWSSQNLGSTVITTRKKTPREYEAPYKPPLGRHLDFVDR